MKKRLSLSSMLLLLTVAAFLFAAAVPGRADMGGFAGDSDYGSSYDDGYSSSGGGYSSSGNSGHNHKKDDDDYSDVDLGLSERTELIIGGVIAVVLIALWIYKSRWEAANYQPKNNNSSSTSGTPKNSGGSTSNTPRNSGGGSGLTDMSQYKKLDPNFSEADFKEKIANMYVRFQNQWTAKDMEPMRGEMTDALYNQIDRQLQPLKDDRQTNRVDNIAVLNVLLRGYRQNDEQDTIVVMVKTRIIDYYVDDDTGSVVKGSRTTEKFMTYEWEMIRKKGMKTGGAERKNVINCPNCGAPVNINHSARCEYCDSILTGADYDWVLASIKGISQQSAG